MKTTPKRLLALVLALLLAMPVFALAEDDGEVLTLPDAGIDLEALDILEADAPEDGDVTLELPADGEIEIPVAEPVAGDVEIPEAQFDLSKLAQPGESAEAATEEAAENGALADNAEATVSVHYVDARGNDKGSVTCNRLLPGHENLGDGWYAVTEDVSYSTRMNVRGYTNLILCDGATLSANDGIWVLRNASLTIWAQSTGKNAGRLVAKGSKEQAGIGGIKNTMGGTITINGGVISAEGNDGSAGIGGGYGSGSGFIRIEINGGQVTATTSMSEQWAVPTTGIGPGCDNVDIGNISITGGKVEATGNNGGAGIHGSSVVISGDEARGDLVNAKGNGGAGISGDSVTINSGHIIATSYLGAGIGGYVNTGADNAIVQVNPSAGNITINGGRIEATGDNGGAGIGGGLSGDTGNVTINGGTVIAKATGHDSAGAGIGGGHRGKCGDITITGGSVTATSEDRGAGIGGGGDLTGSVTISGGTVTATGNGGGAGIGSGADGSAKKGTVTITGGKVTAVGSGMSAGIGGGEGANVRISGTAEVFAYAGGQNEGDPCSAIGHGNNADHMGNVTLGDNMMVQAGASRACDEQKPAFPNNQREGACLYRHNAHILPCNHPGATWSGINEKTHTVEACQYCKQASRQELHDFDPKTHKCRACGYEDKTVYTVTFDTTGGTGRMPAQQLRPFETATLNPCAFTWAGHTFKNWNTEVDGSGKAYADSEAVTLNESITLYAQWYTNVTLVSNSLTVEYDGNLHSVSGYTAILRNKRLRAKFPGVSASVEEREIGTYPVKFSGVTLGKTADETGNYVVTVLEEGQLVITKKTPKVTPPQPVKGLVYDGSPHKLVRPGVADGGRMLYSLDNKTWVGTIPQATDAGEYTVWYKSVGDEAHSDPQSGKVSVTVAQRPLNIIADKQEKVEGDPDPELTYGADRMVLVDRLTGHLTRDAGEAPGQYAIRIGTLTAGKNYQINFTGNWLVIKEKPTPTTKPEPEPEETVTPEPEPKPEPVETVTPEPEPKPEPMETVTPEPEPMPEPVETVTPEPEPMPEPVETVTPKPVKPTAKPTAKPTVKPTAKPTVKPTVKPTKAPKPTTEPTVKPTIAPEPTEQPQPVRPDFTLLARMEASGATTLVLSWTKVDGADGYDILFGRCGGSFDQYKTVRSNRTRIRLTGLKPGASYKACVRAWKRKGGKSTDIGKASPTVHAITGGDNGQKCNARSIQLNVTRVTLKKGKRFTPEAKVKGVRSGMALLPHEKALRYYSTDRNVATVSASGKIKAKGPGRCTIYVLAHNGVRAKVLVRVNN